MLHSFQLSEFSKAGELHLAPHGQIADFPTELWLRHYKPVLLLFPLLFRAKMAVIESSRLLA